MITRSTGGSRVIFHEINGFVQNGLHRYRPLSHPPEQTRDDDPRPSAFRFAV
jgi:hypothetical protein